jgi:hypothetical protein
MKINMDFSQDDIGTLLMVFATALNEIVLKLQDQTLTPDNRASLQTMQGTVQDLSKRINNAEWI